MDNAADDVAGSKMIFGWSAMHACLSYLAQKQIPIDSFVPFMAGRHIPVSTSDASNSAVSVKSLELPGASTAADGDSEQKPYGTTVTDHSDVSDGPEGVSFEIDPHDVEESKLWTEKIMSDPLVQEQIRINNLIPEESFVHGEDAIVRIKLKPDADTKKFFRPQYPIAESKKELMKATVERWNLTKRIERAPAWCKYNNPLLGVAKMEGGLAVPGKIRVCLVDNVSIQVTSTGGFKWIV
jgi:hypothetical protein